MLSEHNSAHVYGRGFDPDTCPECAAMLDRLVRNAERWAKKALVHSSK